MIDSRFTVESLKTLLQGLPNVLVKRFQLELANGVKIEKVAPLTRDFEPAPSASPHEMTSPSSSVKIP